MNISNKRIECNADGRLDSLNAAGPNIGFPPENSKKGGHIYFQQNFPLCPFSPIFRSASSNNNYAKFSPYLVKIRVRCGKSENYIDVEKMSPTVFPLFTLLSLFLRIIAFLNFPQRPKLNIYMATYNITNEKKCKI